MRDSRRKLVILFCMIITFAWMPNQNVSAASFKMAKCKIELSKTKYIYTTKAIKPKVVVKNREKTLERNKDYTVSYSNNRKPGIATVTIKGKGKYKGTVKKKFKIKNGLSVKIQNQKVTYTGKAQRPSITVKCGRKKLSPQKYVVKYQNNINVGIASIIIKGKGKYKKKRAYVEFEIVAGEPTTEKQTTTENQITTESQSSVENQTTTQIQPSTENQTTTQELPTTQIQPSTENQTTTQELPTTEETVENLDAHKQMLDYAESIKTIHNPDQGFFKPLYVAVTPDGLQYKKNEITDDYRLYHLRVDISEFSKVRNGSEDLELTSVALEQFAQLLELMQDREKNVIIRCAYDPKFRGGVNYEPDREMMLRHVEQLSDVLNEYPDVITAIEVGMIGPWGEMHTSKIAKDKDFNYKLLDAFLEYTDSYPILVRTPERIYDYLGIKLAQIDNYTVEKDSKAYRLSVFNDAYLENGTDCGTFDDREKEVRWLAKQTNHLPYGGEATNTESTFHDIEVCTPEMFQIHLSYLNMLWDDGVIAKWKDTTYTSACGSDELYYGTSAFTYIDNHIGYRFVLKDATFIYPDSLENMQIQLQLKNVGFGNLNRTKKIEILLKDCNGNITTVSVGDWDGSERICVDLNLTEQNLSAGNYEVYLRVDNGQGAYAIEFANDLWDANLKANHIGSFVKQAQ